MKKTLFFLVLFSVQIVTAQIQVAILEPVGVTPEVTLMHRSMVRGEMVKAIGRQNGYVAFNRADIDQIMKEQNFQQSGMVDDATRKRLGAMQGVDCVCITKITKEGNIYYLEANLVDIESGQISNPATQYGELQGGSLANMLAACEKLAAELVGNTVASPHTATTSSTSLSLSGIPLNQQTTDFVINKRLLQERGFRFPKSQNEAIATLRTSSGEVNIVCSSYNASAFEGARCYGATFDEDSGLNGLAIINTGYEWIMCYIVSSSIVYPYMNFRTDNEDGNHYFVGIEERTCSYGCAYHPNWDSSDDRNICPCMQEIFGKNVTTINFIQEVVNKEFYLPELQKSFEDFLRNGGTLDCFWSDDED